MTDRIAALLAERDGLYEALERARLARDEAVAAFRQSPPPDLRVIHDGSGRVTRLLLAGEVVE